MHVQDLMSSPAVTCHVNDTLQVAAQLMWDHDCGALPVVTDTGTCVGMITDRDVCMAAYTQGRSLDAMLVHGAMSKHVISARPGQRVGELEQLMAQHQIRRIPVIDAEGRPIGIVSLNDLAIESAQPDTRMKQGLAKVAHTLAAICRPRVTRKAA